MMTWTFSFYVIYVGNVCGVVTADNVALARDMVLQELNEHDIVCDVGNSDLIPMVTSARKLRILSAV